MRLFMHEKPPSHSPNKAVYFTDLFNGFVQKRIIQYLVRYLVSDSTTRPWRSCQGTRRLSNRSFLLFDPLSIRKNPTAPSSIAPPSAAAAAASIRRARPTKRFRVVVFLIGSDSSAMSPETDQVQLVPASQKATDHAPTFLSK